MKTAGRAKSGATVPKERERLRAQKASGTKMLEDPAQARMLFKPMRIEIMKLLAEAKTCTELADALNTTPQKIYYHVKVLEKGGLVEKVREQKVRGIVEGVYRAVASTFRLAPDLADRFGGDPTSPSALSIGYLTGLVRDLLLDANRLADSGHDVPTLSIDARVELAGDANRSAFRREVEETIQKIASKYGRTDRADDNDPAGGETFKLVLVCYPDPEKQTGTE